MSFRESFTRSSNENLQYDDAAAQHFFMTILIIVVLPLLYSLLKSALFPFSHIKSLSQLEKEPRFKAKILKYKKENRFKFLTFGYVLKLVLAIFLGYLIYNTHRAVKSSNQQMKGFDPHEILQVSEDATINEIKKSYRKLALQYHPDRNDNDPQSAAMFIMISKAYECLTDDKAKENCLKFGNPEGTNSFNVGIALPEILVRPENQVKVMLFVLVIMVIIVPSILLCWNSDIDSVDEEGALIKNHPNIMKSLNQNLSIKNVLNIVSTSWQFEKLPTKARQLPALEYMYNQISSDDKEAMNIKKNYYNFFKKSFVLIDAQMNSRKVPPQLQQNFVYVQRIVPKLMNSIINIALPISTYIYKMNPHPQQAFVGITALQSLIWFEQRFIQGCNFDAPEIAQLDLSQQELDKAKKKKRNKIPALKFLQQSEDQLEKFLALFEQYRKAEIKRQIFMFPQVDLKANVYVPGGQQQINDKSLVEVKVLINHKNPQQFVMSNRYPYLKQQRWYLFIIMNKMLLHFNKFTFEGKNSKQFTYNHPVFLKAGVHDWRVCLMPDSYFGFDIDYLLKFQVVKTTKKHDFKPHKEDTEIDTNDSMFSKLLNNLVPQEDQELSDTEKEEKLMEEIPEGE